MASTYTYAQVADRLEQEFGTRPSLSSLRAAAATDRRTRSTKGSPRLTAQMPAPLPKPSRTSSARFDATMIEAWLASHPLRTWNRASDELRQGLEASEDHDALILRARDRGLSWRAITQLLNAHDGGTRSVAGIHKAYKDR